MTAPLASGIISYHNHTNGECVHPYLNVFLLFAGDVVMRIKDELMSAPYVHMTMNLMKKVTPTLTFVCSESNVVTTI